MRKMAAGWTSHSTKLETKTKSAEAPVKTAEGTTSQEMAMGSSIRDLAPAWERASTEARSQSWRAADLAAAAAAARGMEWAGCRVLERRWAQQWAMPWAAGWSQRKLQQQHEEQGQ